MVWTSADERAKNSEPGSESEGYEICSLCRNRSLFIVRSCKFLSFFSIVAKCRLLQIDGLINHPLVGAGQEEEEE